MNKTSTSDQIIERWQHTADALTSAKAHVREAFLQLQRHKGPDTSETLRAALLAQMSAKTQVRELMDSMWLSNSEDTGASERFR